MCMSVCLSVCLPLCLPLCVCVCVCMYVCLRLGVSPLLPFVCICACSCEMDGASHTHQRNNVQGATFAPLGSALEIHTGICRCKQKEQRSRRGHNLVMFPSQEHRARERETHAPASHVPFEARMNIMLAFSSMTSCRGEREPSMSGFTFRCPSECLAASKHRPKPSKQANVSITQGSGKQTERTRTRTRTHRHAHAHTHTHNRHRR